MRLEFSAGGVVFRRLKLGDGSQRAVEILLCQHSYHHGWGFPKGLIGDKIDGEGKEETALREVEEETGARAKIFTEIEPVTYWFKFKDEKIKKTVYYYVMEYIDGDITKHDFEMENVEWVPFDKVIEKLTYKSDKKVFEKAKELLVKFANS